MPAAASTGPSTPQYQSSVPALQRWAEFLATNRSPRSIRVSDVKIPHRATHTHTHNNHETRNAQGRDVYQKHPEDFARIHVNTLDDTDVPDTDEVWVEKGYLC